MERTTIYHSDPDILGGTLVFVGTRVPIDTLLVYLRKSKRIEDFRDDFPTVTRKQVEGLLGWQSVTSRQGCDPRPTR
ncbi:DUF433 domain-containing protein [Rubrivirga sp.]|uniref:DUF433 domain-containing protein n=1 Tax=Rubrivirga sp. TaxID=1885344 RepID=UPI003C735CD3